MPYGVGFSFVYALFDERDSRWGLTLNFTYRQVEANGTKIITMVFVPGLIALFLFVFFVYRNNRYKFISFSLWEKIQYVILYTAAGLVLLVAIAVIEIFFGKHS